jgi:hypothetical protein
MIEGGERVVLFLKAMTYEVGGWCGVIWLMMTLIGEATF